MFQTGSTQNKYCKGNSLPITVAQPKLNTKMAVFWVAAPCSLVEVYQRFRDRCCLRHQGDAMIKISK
jgi:hypothetical protein